MHTTQKKAKRRQYPSNISHNGWKKLKPYLPKPKAAPGKAGRQPADLKQVINGIM